ncbi:hypothetical protein EG328_010681 [Venturia inaequalis]|uniref:BRCT domain-containing protein n=2 Tax=Venturia inaequalis TaxID=5025 RepID=A0A8H3Z4B9_VENIN|nr:hypothetical protein EG328_010681 [Venturia inaequalis]RDI84354.1 hypothetical protein Vi05172_g5636 [Venturia inaequalis]
MESVQTPTTWDTLQARNYQAEILGAAHSDSPYSQDCTGKQTATPSPVKVAVVQQYSTIANSQSARDGSQRRRAFHSQEHVPPHLRSSKSSPMPAFDKEKAHGSKMWNSFADAEDPADTQPVDTQVFIAESDIATSRIDEGINGLGSYHISDYAVDEPHGSVIVDLVANVEEPEPQVYYDDDVSDVSSQADEITNVFKVPKTPAMNGRKRNARGEIAGSETRTSAIKTPGSELPMAGLFGGGGTNNIQLSQLFAATQAPSSPLPNCPKSDPVFDRPSPNINFRLGNSSPVALPYSSPTRPSSVDVFVNGRILSDPLDTYVPMNESQEERERRLQREQELAESVEDDEFEDSHSALWRQQQKKIHQVALTSAAELTAPDRRRPPGPGRPRKIARSKSATDAGSAIRHRSSSRTERNSGARPFMIDALFEKQAPLPQESSVEEMNVVELAVNGTDVSQSQGNVMDEIIVPDTSPRSTQSRRKARCIRSPSPSMSQQRNHEIDAPTATQKTVIVVDSQADRVDVVAHEQDDLARPATKIAYSTVSSQARISQTQSQHYSLGPENRTSMNKRILGATETSSVPPPSPPSRAEEIIPSSPPLLSTQASDDDQDINDDEVEVTGVAAKIAQPVLIGHLPHTIAESEQDGIGDGVQQLQSPQLANQKTEPATIVDMAMDDESEPFATANSHLSMAAEKKVQYTETDRPQVGEIRKFGDLVVEAEPQNSIDSADINFDILTEGDQEFHNMMADSSPVRPKKKQRVYGRSALREPSKMANITNSDIAQEVTEMSKEPTPKKLVEVSEAPESTPITEGLPTPTPQSTKKRELDGANAASHARQAILAAKDVPSAKPRVLCRPAKITKTTNKSGVAKPSTSTSSSSGRPRPRSLKILEVAETTSTRLTSPKRVDGTRAVSVQNRRKLSMSKKEVSKSVAPQIQDHVDVPSSDTSPETEIFPNRVLAMFRGDMNYYTATVLGLVRGDGVKFRVRYDDRNEDTMDAAHLRKLELRIGDRVKAELPKMKTKTFIVVGFSNPVNPEAENNSVPDSLGPSLGPLPDVYGHLNVKLRVKGRQSLPTPEPTSGEIFDVPIQYIYLSRTMVSSLTNRQYVGNPGSFGRLTTPSNFDSTPSTPSSRSRRQPGTTISRASVVPSILEIGMFANMAFAVTFSESHNKEKESTLNCVQNNGARIIEVGFDQLFDLDPSGAPTPKKASPRKLDQATSTQPDSLNLLRDAKNLGFTALIADRYCRRAKYVQALALSIPCLHYRWVSDSIAAGEVLPFQKYLLPAGESAFLSGAVRSRSLVPYNPCSEDAKLKNILSRRDLLLGGKSVLVVKGKGKDEEKRKIYLFLTYALGAAEVGRVKDLTEAKAELESRPWDWVYVDGEPEEAKKVLFGKEKGKKRKSESSVVGALVGGKAVKVVGDEFVIQSLILGALMEE